MHIHYSAACKLVNFASLRARGIKGQKTHKADHKQVNNIQKKERSIHFLYLVKIEMVKDPAENPFLRDEFFPDWDVLDLSPFLF